MIRIHLGHVDAGSRPSSQVVREPDDYIPARKAIRDALRVSADLELFVLSRVCDQWFWDLEGYSDVQLLQEDPRDLLRAKLQTGALPAELSDPLAISELEILDLPSPVAAVDDVIAWVLGHKLGDVWLVNEPSYEHLTQLVAALATCPVPRLLEPLVERRILAWAGRAGGQIGEAYRLIAATGSRGISFLCAYRALKVYDEATRILWLEEERWYLPGLQWIADKLGELPIPLAVDSSLSPKAEAHWRRRLRERDKEAAA